MKTLYTSEPLQSPTKWWDILAPFSSKRGRNILVICTIASGIIQVGLDRIYEFDWQGLNEVIYLTVSDGRTYSVGEWLHESSGVLETFFTWWLTAKFITGLVTNSFEKILSTLFNLSALFKMTSSIVLGVFFVFTNPYIINLARTTYVNWEIGLYAFNVLLFIVLPYILRQVFIVKVKAGKK